MRTQLLRCVLFGTITCIATATHPLLTSLFHSNVEPMLAPDGTIMNCHEHDLQQVGDMFYLYCLTKDLCHLHKSDTGCPSNVKECGRALDHNITLWTSHDLQTWTYQSNLLPPSQRPNGGPYYRPAVLINPTTNQTVLWLDFHPDIGDYGKLQMLVASAPTPAGPFSIVTPNASLLYKTGDHSVFQDNEDPNHTAYVVYRSHHDVHGHDKDLGISIEQLAPDYLSSLGPSDPQRYSSGPVTADKVEAPVMFRRNGLYYLIAGGDCCECARGSSPLLVYTATQPLGPYTLQGDVSNHDSKGRTATHSQQARVVQLPSIVDPPFLWIGDRWQSAPDGLHGHDFAYWAPLRFNDSATPPTVLPFDWVDNFTLLQKETATTEE